jgi:hypothetical protein
MVLKHSGSGNRKTKMKKDDPYRDLDLGKFRYAVAGYIKCLIRARWKVDPGFLTPEDLERWGLKKIDHDPPHASDLMHEAAKLMQEAANALGRLNTEVHSTGGLWRATALGQSGEFAH